MELPVSNSMFSMRTKAALIKGVITKKVPIYVQYAVTKNCNLRCKMCNSSLSREKEGELTLPEIKKLANVLDKLNVGIIVLTGGEPFLRKDIPDIIHLFSQKGFTVRLQTNGILPHEDIIKSACQAGMKEITISLNSLYPEKHDSITGQRGSWYKVIESISQFSQILPTTGTLLGVNTVVSRKNLGELVNIIKFVSEIGFNSSLIPVHLTSSKKDNFIIRKFAPEFAFHPDDFNEIDHVYEEIMTMKKKGYSIYNSNKFLRNSPMFLKGKTVKWHCDSPDLYFAISPSGKFLPCVDLKTSISMLDDGFVDLYNSKEFKTKIHEMVKKCPGCFYACWPEMTFLCRDLSVFVERIFWGIKATFKKRKPVTYKECLKIIDNIKKYGSHQSKK